jgi:hypothetical protein
VTCQPLSIFQVKNFAKSEEALLFLQVLIRVPIFEFLVVKESSQLLSQDLDELVDQKFLRSD